MESDTTSTTLSEFVEQDAEGGDPDTLPEQNAANIEDLIDLVETLTEQIEDVAKQVDQGDPNGQSIDTEPTDERSMFQ